MGDVLDLIGVTVVRNEATLLDEVTWTVREGERWVLLGPNGAGKTTLLQIAGARLHPTRGTARILDETLGGVDVFELRPRIGLSSAAFAETIPGHERVADVVLTAAYAVAGRWHESYDPLDHRRSGDLLAAFGVAHLADRTFGTLSEGERKRVQLARSLMTDPELVLLDEPAAGLDLGGRETLVQDLAELAGDRRSPVLILVTHHVEEIPPGFTHALLLRQGRVVAAGPIEDVLTDETLTATFDVPLAVRRSDDRWSARIRTGREAAPPADALGEVARDAAGPDDASASETDGVGGNEPAWHGQRGHDDELAPAGAEASEVGGSQVVDSHLDSGVVDAEVVEDAEVVVEAEVVEDGRPADDVHEAHEAHVVQDTRVVETGAAGLAGTAWGAERPAHPGTAHQQVHVSQGEAAPAPTGPGEWVTSHHG